MPRKTIMAIDPGTSKSGVVLWDGKVVSLAGVYSNEETLNLVRAGTLGDADILAIENVSSYGMPVGKEVFETCLWIGRFVQHWLDIAEHLGRRQPKNLDSVRLVMRPSVKTHLCGTSKAKDSNVAQAVRDRVGGKGTKSNKGPTYYVASHSIQALALGIYISDYERIAA